MEELAAGRLTVAEQQQRTEAAAAKLGLECSEQVRRAGQSAWEKVRAHQNGAAA
ncbi:hypothetical protein ACLF6K_06895 [Streptomyces xanthophaeus]|uniref:hypothetical protein n=1 Tax=Streptomyces xanthophaeus TaxID=67385 RepID=UPI00398FCE8D